MYPVWSSIFLVTGLDSAYHFSRLAVFPIHNNNNTFSKIDFFFSKSICSNLVLFSNRFHYAIAVVEFVTRAPDSQYVKYFFIIFFFPTIILNLQLFSRFHRTELLPYLNIYIYRNNDNFFFLHRLNRGHDREYVTMPTQYFRHCELSFYKLYIFHTVMFNPFWICKFLF